MTIIIFIYGIIIGSFLNVCIYRLPREESVVFPPSHCPTCHGRLGWYDNIPLISYLGLGGKCRYCRRTISLQYPMVEALNGLIYIGFYLHFGLTLDFLFFSLISSVLLVISIIDLKWMLIPDILIIVGFILEIARKLAKYLILSQNINILDSLLGLFLAGGLFYLIFVLSKGGIGDGDIVLIGFLGFILGLKLIFLNIFLSFILGALISILLLIFKIKSRKDPIPFGPFIILAFFLVLFYGNNIINCYLELLYY